MPPRPFSFLSSNPFEIKSHDKSYFIHEDILATQWKPLHSAALKEAGKIDLSDWDSDIVELFAEFLYTKDYQVPGSIFGEEGGGEDEGGERRDGANTPDTIQSLTARIESGFGDIDENWLVIHAKVYMLARYKGIEALKATAFEKLRMALVEISGRISTPSAAADFIELFVYVYSDTEWDRSMRDLVLAFAAEKFEKLVGRREMGLLLSEGGNLVVELMEKVAKRIFKLGEPCAVVEAEKAEKKLCDVEKELQVWKDRAAALEEKVWELEVASARRIQQLEAVNSKILQSEGTISRIELSKAEEVQQLEAVIRVLEAINSEMRESEAANMDKIRRLKADNVEKTHQLEVVNEKVKWLKGVGAVGMR